jgi:NAD+ diphosphatase
VSLQRLGEAPLCRADTSLDLDNELEDAQFFPRSVVARVAGSKHGSKFTKEDYNQLDKATEDRDVNAPAFIDPRPMDKFENFTKCPPATAIAGVLMRQWALGTHATHLVSSL